MCEAAGLERAVSRGPGVGPERQPATDRWPLNSITLNPMPYKGLDVSILLYIGMIKRPSALIKRPLALILKPAMIKWLALS